MSFLEEQEKSTQKTTKEKFDSVYGSGRANEILDNKNIRNPDGVTIKKTLINAEKDIKKREQDSLILDAAIEGLLR